jgi:hypothetical protein
MIKILPFLIIFLFLAKPVQAVCPVCTVAVGSALGISRLLGIDDLVSSLWIGALILSSSLWMSDYLMKKDSYKKYANPYQISALFYLLVIIPLYFTGTIGSPTNIFLGVDKILLGIIFGSLIFLLSIFLDKRVREIKGKQLFNYQKVIFPLALLLIVSILVNYLVKWPK